MSCNIVLTDKDKNSQVYKILAKYNSEEVANKLYLKYKINAKSSSTENKYIAKNNVAANVPQQRSILNTTENLNTLTSSQLKFLKVYPEFKDKQQQDDAIDTMALGIIKALKTVPEAADKLSPIGINLATLKNYGVLNMAIRKFTGDISHSNSNLTVSMMSNIRKYFKDNNNIGILGKVLMNYDIDVSTLNSKNITEETEDINNEQELIKDEEKTRYGIAPTDIQILSTIQAPVRVYVKTVRDIESKFEYQEGKPIKYKKTTMGFAPGNFQALESILYKNTTTAKTPEEMIDNLKHYVKDNPIIAPILVDLLDERENGGVKLDDGSLYYPLSTALFTTHSTRNYNMFSAVKYKKASAIVNSDFNSTVKNIQKEWQYNVEKFQETSTPALRKELLDVIKDMTNIKNFSNSIDQGKILDYSYFYIAKAFRAIGYKNVTMKTFSNLVIDYINNKEIVVGDSFKKDTLSTGASDVIIPIIEYLGIKALKGDDAIFKTVGEGATKRKGEFKYLRILAKAVARATNDEYIGSFHSKKGGTIHPINKSTEALEVFNRLKDLNESDPLTKDPMYKNTYILKYLRDADISKNLKFRTFSSFDKAEESKGYGYNELSPTESIAVRLTSYFNPQIEGQYIAFAPIQADRGNMAGLVVPKINYLGGRDNQVMEYGADKPYVASNEIREWVSNEILGELKRMQKAYKSKIVYKDYSTNAKRFSEFYELNDLLDIDNKSKLDFTDIGVKDLHLQAEQHIDDIVAKIIKDDTNYLIDNNVLKKSRFPGYDMTDTAKKVVSTNIENLSIFKLENFIINNFIYTHEQALFLQGDLALFGNGSDDNIKIAGNKRAGLAFTPDTKPAYGKGTGLPTTMNLKILKELVYNSPNSEVYKEVLKNTNKTKDAEYKGIKLADGTLLIGAKMYDKLKKGLALSTEEESNYLNSEAKWKQGKEVPHSESKSGVPKPFYSRLQVGPDGTMINLTLKTAITLVSPSYYEQLDNSGDPKFPAMYKISKELNREGGADVIALESAVKSGAHYITTIDNLEKAKSITLFNNSLRFPQSIYTNNKIEKFEGSQTNLIGRANTIDEGTLHIEGQQLNEVDAKEIYVDSLKHVMANKGNKLKNAYIKNGKFNEEFVTKQALSNAVRDSYTNSEFLEDALTKTEDGTYLPVNYPSIINNFTSGISSSFTSKVIRLKVKGYAATQIANINQSFSKGDGSIITDTALKFIGFKRISDNYELSKKESIELAKRIAKGEDISKEYVTTPAEVRVTPQYFLGTLKKIAINYIDKHEVDAKVSKMLAMFKRQKVKDITSNINKYKRGVIETAKEKVLADMYKSFFKNGKLNIGKIRDAGLDEILVYRIPTEGKSSMINSKITEFLPKEYGSTIQVSPEFVMQTGSDFDFNKLYIETPSFTVRKTIANEYRYSKDKLEFNEDGDFVSNGVEDDLLYIHNYRKAIMASTNHVIEILNPNNIEMLKEIRKGYGIGKRKLGNYASLKTQEEFKYNNDSGSTMIAISANASMGHIKSVEMEVEFINPIYLNGSKIDLTRIHNIEDSTLISAIIQQIEDAALDNVKDPILGDLNMNEFTASALNLVIKSGNGLQFASDIINAPIVKYMSRNYAEYKKLYGKNEIIKHLASDAMRKFGIKHQNTVDLNKYTKLNAKEGLKEGYKDKSLFKEIQAKALAVFVELKKSGDILSDAYIDLNTNAKGTGTTPQRAVDRYISLVNIKGTTLNLEELGKTPKNEKNNIKEYKNHEEIISALKELGKKMYKTDSNADFYTVTENGESNKVQRISDFSSDDKPDPTNKKVIQGGNRGNIVDGLGREFFENIKTDKEYTIKANSKISTKAADTLTKIFTSMYKDFYTRGEVPYTNEEYLQIFDTKAGNMGLGGTMDMITLDKNNVLRIYDFKTRNQLHRDGYQGKFYDGKDYSRHDKQLNSYRGVLRNKLDISASELFIIPIVVKANEDGTYINDIEYYKYDHNNTLVKHDINNNIIADTRGSNINLKGTFMKELNRSLNMKKINSGVKVNPIKYNKSIFSTIDEYGVKIPLEVMGKISDIPTKKGQDIVNYIKKNLPYTPVDTFIKVFAEYKTMQLQNSNATSASISGLSRFIDNGGIDKLLNSDNANSTANLLDKYKNKFKSKQEQPLFIQQLSIEQQGNYKFVVFKKANLYAKLDATMKRKYQESYLELVENGDAEERTLAKSLGLYAAAIYGYSVSPNSFMFMLPAYAHANYMNGIGGTQASEHFRKIYNVQDNTDIDTITAENYIDLYVANNWYSIGLPYKSKFSEYGDSQYEDANTKSPTYILSSEKGVTVIKKLISDKAELIKNQIVDLQNKKVISIETEKQALNIEIEKLQKKLKYISPNRYTILDKRGIKEYMKDYSMNDNDAKYNVSS